MATKNQVDSSVAERRLRPIYDWLDIGNNKKALQEAEKVLKKQPNFQCAKVLKGLALLRLGKEVECEQLLDTIRQEVYCDDSTLQAMTICYREMNKPEVICEVYAAAAKKDPKNEELLTHLFMAYVRVCDYKKQQQTAMILYKLKFKNHYYFWTVMSIVMQAFAVGPDLAKSLQLPLAEKMVKKFVDEDKIEAEQEVQLYLMVLEMQDKLGEALSVLDGSLGEMLQSYIIVPVKRVELLVKMACWKKANVAVKNILSNDMDNWNLYLNYFRTVFHIVDEKDNETEEVDGDTWDKTIDDGVSFLSEIQVKNSQENHRLRGPYLAQLELYLQLLDRGDKPEPLLGKLTDLLLEYFNSFGSKPCCLNDLRTYLDRLDGEQVNTFLNNIWEVIQLEEGQLPTSKEQMLRYISNLHITRYLGFHETLTNKAKIHLSECLLRYYNHAAQFNGPNLLPTDITHNDPFAILIAHMMNDIWLTTNEATFLKNAIVVLEHALSKSPSNHQLKLLLVKFYNNLGISKAAHRVFEMLDVKHVQLDSMGYLQCWSLVSTGQYSLASDLFEVTLKFFTSNYKDSADHLTFLYKFGSFLKISEFIEFRDRLNNSLHYSLVTVEKMLMEILHSTSYQQTTQLITQMTIQPEKDCIQYDALEDNRDLDLCWTADPSSRQLTDEMVKRSFSHDIELLRIRALILRILAGATQLRSDSHICTNGKHNGNSNNSEQCKLDPRKTLVNLAQELANSTTSLSQRSFSKLPKNIMNAPPDSRLFYLMELPFLGLVLDLVNVVLDLSGDDTASYLKQENHVGQDREKVLPDATSECVLKLTQSISIFSTQVRNCDHSELGLRINMLNHLTFLVEMVSVTALFCGVAVQIIKSCLRPLIKKGKRRKEPSTTLQIGKGGNEQDTMRMNIVKQLLEFTSSSVQQLDSSVSFIEDKWREPVLSVENNLINLIDGLSLEDNDLPERCIVEKLISDSYLSSFSEIHTILKSKTKYLSELQL